jgi:hypothetical protein
MARLHPLSIAATALIASVGIAIGVAMADSPVAPKNPVPPDWNSETARQDMEAARQAVSKPQLAYLEDFNTGRRNVDGMPHGEIEVFGDLPFEFERLVPMADAILVAVAERVQYEGSGMQDIPLTTVTYRVERSVTGPLQKGDRFALNYLGGPYRQPTGEEVFLDEGNNPTDQLGDRAFMLIRRSARGDWESLGAGGKLELAGNRVAARKRADLAPAWDGRTVDEMIAIVKGSGAK